MIPLAEIDAIAAKLQIPADSVEKDYIICWLLQCLSRSSLGKNFIFYGGTAIKRIYFDDHRYSEDIDLTSRLRFKLDVILRELECLRFAKQEANIELFVMQNRIESTKDRIQVFIGYTGFDEIVGAPKEIKIDFTMDREVFGEATTKKVIRSYSDLPMENNSLEVMSLNTILANKFGMLHDNTRNEPRDIFDIWFLLNRIDRFDFDLDRVLTYYKEKYGFRPTLNTVLSGLENKKSASTWLVRLSKQMTELPPMKRVISDIKAILERLLESK
jgi:uncharacterized protein